MITITTISDTHGQHTKLEVGSGDLIIHAGDATPRGKMEDVETFLRWYGDLDFDKKIMIAGNHDWDFEKLPKYCEELCNNYGVTLLNDSGVKYKGLHIWGSPVQPKFLNWAFNRSRTKEDATKRNPFIGEHWDKIPSKVDILVTHGPANKILDLTKDNVRAGCELLRKKIEEVKPVLHVCGHIHESRGIYIDPSGPTTYVNTASIDEQYRPYPEKSFRFNWNKLILGQSLGQD